MKKKFALLVTIFSAISFSIGAATGTKINAILMNQTIVCDGVSQMKQVISYDGKTYVPLREFGNLTGTSISYTNGKIYVGSNNTIDTPVNSSEKKFLFTINGVSTGIDFANNKVAIVDISMKNNSGESTSPGGSLYSITAYQNGVELEKTFDGDLAPQDEYTSVLTGSTINFKSLFVLKDNSPVTVEISEFLGKDKVSKTFNLK